MPMYQTKTIAGILEPVAQQVGDESTLHLRYLVTLNWCRDKRKGSILMGFRLIEPGLYARLEMSNTKIVQSHSQ